MFVDRFLVLWVGAVGRVEREPMVNTLTNRDL